MTIGVLARSSLFGAAIVATVSALAPGQALAQAYGYGPYGPGPYGGYRDYGPGPYGGPRDYGDRAPPYDGAGPRRAGAPFASRRAIAILLERRGLRLEGPLDFQGPNIVAVGVDATGYARRFVIDPYEGAVLSAHPLQREAGRPDRGGDDFGPQDRLPPHTGARPRGDAEFGEEEPIWRREPADEQSPARAKKEPPDRDRAADRHDAAPPKAQASLSEGSAHRAIAPPERKKPAQPVAATIPPVAPVVAPHVSPASSQPAPTGPLEPPQPGGGG